MSDMDKKIYYPNCRKCNYATCVGHRPGRALGWSIVERMPNKRVLWAIYNDEEIYPIIGRDKPAKDASDMTDEEIRQCLRNAVPTYRYEQLEMEEKYEKIEQERLQK
jgi:hypothetical protein